MTGHVVRSALTEEDGVTPMVVPDPAMMANLAAFGAMGTGMVRYDTATDTFNVSVAGAAIADASGGLVQDNVARDALNALLARCRVHGLIS